jgi:hypothetical protein
MQLQIECNHLPSKQQSCCLCKRPFESREARVIICNEQGITYGDACPHCISQGFAWMKTQFELLSRPKVTVRKNRKPSKTVAISA